jgi:hypothetical protein
MSNQDKKHEEIGWCCEHLCWDDLNETVDDMCFSECLSLPDPCAVYSEHLMRMMDCDDDPLSEKCED